MSYEQGWWRQFPRPESRELREPGPLDRPLFSVGDSVRLRGKPEQIRRVLKAEWHWHRYEFVYVVETSAELFKPYWFFDQLVLEQSSIAESDKQKPDDLKSQI